MKNSLMLLPVFVIAMLVALAVCPFFYSLSQAETFAALSGGDGAAFFAANLQNALEFLPSAIVVAFSACFVYIVRHKIEGIGTLFVFLVLLLLSFALEPAASRIEASRSHDVERAASIEPQAGLIQETEPRLKTVVLQGSAGIAAPVVIAADTSGSFDGRALNVYSGREAAFLRSSAQGPSLDVQIARKIEEPAFLRKLSRDIGAVHSILSDAARSSASDYIWTAVSFFALVASFFFLCALTDWKLINFTLYAIAVRALYALFPLLHGEACIGFLRRFLPRFFSDAAIAALPALLVALVLAVLGFTLILPHYIRRNQGV